MHSMAAYRELDAFQAFMSTLSNDVQSLRYEVYPHIIVCDVDVLMPRWLRLVYSRHEEVSAHGSLAMKSMMLMLHVSFRY